MLGDSVVLNQSMAQVDKLILQFRDSMSGFSNTSNNFVGSNTTTSTGSALGTMNGSKGSTNAAGDDRNSSGILGFSRSAIQGVDSADPAASAEISAFLEKYSDKLVDLVGEKLISKINASK